MPIHLLGFEGFLSTIQLYRLLRSPGQRPKFARRASLMSRSVLLAACAAEMYELMSCCKSRDLRGGFMVRGLGFGFRVLKRQGLFAVQGYKRFRFHAFSATINTVCLDKVIHRPVRKVKPRPRTLICSYSRKYRVLNNLEHDFVASSIVYSLFGTLGNTSGNYSSRNISINRPQTPESVCMLMQGP